MENNIHNKMLIRQILKQSITSEFEFNWYLQHITVDQLIKYFRIDINKLE